MSFTFKLKLPRSELQKISNKSLELRLGTIKGVKQAMYFVEGEAKKNFNGTNQLHVRSGHLRRSIKTGGVEDHKDYVVGSVGSNVIYAAIHEFGGNAGRGGRTHIRPRPYIKPAFEDNKLKIERIIKKYIDIKVK